MYAARKYAVEMVDEIKNGAESVCGGTQFQIVKGTNGYAHNAPILKLIHYGTLIGVIGVDDQSVSVSWDECGANGWSATDQRFINDVLFLLGINDKMCRRHADYLYITRRE